MPETIKLISKNNTKHFDISGMSTKTNSESSVFKAKNHKTNSESSVFKPKSASHTRDKKKLISKNNTPAARCIGELTINTALKFVTNNLTLLMINSQLTILTQIPN